MYKTNFTCVLQSVDIASAVMEVLELNSEIADRWNVTKPREYSNNTWQFSGSASKSKIPGVKLISFYLHNSEEDGNIKS